MNCPNLYVVDGLFSRKYYCYACQDPRREYDPPVRIDKATAREVCDRWCAWKKCSRSRS